MTDSRKGLKEFELNSPKLNKYKDSSRKAKNYVFDDDIDQENHEPIYNDFSGSNYSTKALGLNHQQSLPVMSNSNSVSNSNVSNSSSINFNNQQSKVLDKPNRRKHHHKRSLSHAFFSFNDPLLSNTTKSTSDLNKRFNNLNNQNISSVNSVREINNNNNVNIKPLKTFERSSFSKRKLCVTLLDLSLGCYLWLLGQKIETLSVIGLGYLLTLDGLSLGFLALFDYNRMVGKSLQRPFGLKRFETLTMLIEIIYLIFSLTYLIKELIELSLIGDDDYEDDPFILQIPLSYLVFSIILPLISTKVYKNFRNLTLLTNLYIPEPFNLNFVSFNSILTSILIIFSNKFIINKPLYQLLDKGIVIILSINTSIIIYSSLFKLCKTLLQTNQNSHLIHDIESSLSDYNIKQVNLFEISTIDQNQSSNFKLNLKISINQQSTDQDIFNLTKILNETLLSLSINQFTIDVRRDN